MLTIDRVNELLANFARLRLTVVGDLMLDRYWQGTADRISPEAPVPVVRVSREICVPGGAANVAVNIAALGARATVAGLCGEDADGIVLNRLLAEMNIDCDGVLTLNHLHTIVKTRVVADRQQVVRVDREEPLDLDVSEIGRLTELVRRAVGSADGVIMEDYGKGTLTQHVVDAVLDEARRKDIPVGFDPKDNHDLRTEGVTLATPNWREAVIGAGFSGSVRETDAATPDLLERVADRLLKKWAPRLLIITLGSQGMYLASRGGLRQLIPTRAREVFDVSGAGDTVIAACLLSLAAGASDVEAAEVGNHAAGVVVGKLGTASCKHFELAASMTGGEVSVA